MKMYWLLVDCSYLRIGISRTIYVEEVLTILVWGWVTKTQEGDLVEMWVRACGCAAEINILLHPSGLVIAPYYFEKG